MFQCLRGLCLLLAVCLVACGDSSLPLSSGSGSGQTPGGIPTTPPGTTSGGLGDLSLPALTLVAPPASRERASPHSVAGSKALLRFELRLSEPSTKAVSVVVTSRDDTATAGEDYLALAQTVTIPAGERRVFVPVRLQDDARVERDERFTLELSAPQNARLEIASAAGHIVDDDLAPGCNPPPARGLCAGAAEGALRIPIGAPLGGYLRPPVGGEYVPQLEALGEGDAVPFFTAFLGFVPGVSEGGGSNVTPPNEARRSQYSTLSPSSRGYYDTLTTKAVALTQGGRTVVFVKLDTVGIVDELNDGIRAKVLAATGIDLGDGLVLNATHTHDGPGAIGNTSVKYFWAALDLFHQDLFDQAVDSIAKVVVQALANRVPARFGYAVGLEGTAEKQLNSFRRSRAPYTAERVAEQDLVRRRLGVFRIDQIDSAGAAMRPLAIMVNYAAHGIVFDVENLFYSGDALAGMERAVEARFDTPVVVMQVQAADGDVSPRADGDPKRQRIERFGELLAPQVLVLWDRIDNFNAAPALKMLTQRFILSREKLGYAADEYPYPFGAVQCNPMEGVPVCVPSPPNGAADLADNGVAENDSFVPQDSRIAVIQIGSAVIVTQPGEPLTEQGLRLLEASPFKRDDTFIWGYTLDHIGYILPDLKADWDLGGTEGTTTFWGWKQGGRILELSKGLMEALKAGTPASPDEFQIAYTALPALPAVTTTSLSPGRIAVQPGDLTRFEQTRFVFEGGDPVIDLPTVTLEEDVDGTWQPMRRFNARPLDRYFEFWIEYLLSNGAHSYTIRFEPAKDFPVGRYRFRANGVAMMAPGTGDYEAISEAFTVGESETLLISDIRRDGDRVSATLSYTPVPGNYRLVEAVGDSATPAPVHLGVVRFALGNALAEARTPVLSTLEDGRVLATYTASLPGSALPTASARDAFGNRSAATP